MTLPATDLGLMAEHLAAHKGMINKLKRYYSTVSITALKKIISLQVNTMSAHVRVMLTLINPNHGGYVEVPPLHYMKNSPSADAFDQNLGSDNKWIALEAHAAAKSMATTNFTSALLMKDTNVKYAHIEMALQQVTLQEMYAEVIKGREWSFVPHVSVDDQINTYQHYQNLFYEHK
ncbi:hypothetical protein [Halobacillus amylolyticus]|uniref:Spore coat protein n=1 Tax=Halobacillus amylolyticus TaxID=2932259 RepID=A0ABY4HE62_9BACI|nr:hypothetical protein [Halobacillus amylolyticus]UOR11690.1 hypothetical protein MUO15_19310 [Halobacillus amylolyticus]